MKTFFILTVFSLFLLADDEAKPNRAQTCKIKKISTYYSYSSQCTGPNEVMIGIQSVSPTIVLKCAKIQAECPNRKTISIERD
jgi:hypothetical protein